MFRKRLSLTLCMCLITAATIQVWNMVPSVMTAGQKKERKLKARPWRDEPIRVTSVQGNGDKIVLGEPKLAEDDWLRNLTITIQNTSKKDIVFVELELHFLRPEGSPESVTAFPIIFGTPPGKVNENSPILTPGETWQSSLSDKDYTVLQELLNGTGYATGTVEVELITREVLFRDKKKWFAGEEKDPDQAAAQVRKKAPSEPGLFQHFRFPSRRISFLDPKPGTPAPLFACGNASPTTPLQCFPCTPVQNGGSVCCTIKRDIVTTDPNGQSEGRSVSLPCRNPADLSTELCNGQWNTVTKAVACQSACKPHFQICSLTSECCSGLTCLTVPFDPGTKACQYNSAQEECVASGWYWNSTFQKCAPSATQSGCTGSGWWWNSFYGYCQYCPNSQCPLNYTKDEDCNCTIYTGEGSPIVVDVNGNGFKLTDVTNGVAFDLNNDGTAEHLAWTVAGSDDSWLVLDRNGNGIIDSGLEMFGNFTPQPAPPTGVQRNGFAALAEFDKPANGGNDDGAITSADVIFLSLRLWQDSNHNGTSETSELKTLTASGVNRIDCEYKESKRTDEFGNRFRYRAKVKDAQGSQLGRWAWDVFLVKQ